MLDTTMTEEEAKNLGYLSVVEVAKIVKRTSHHLRYLIRLGKIAARFAIVKNQRQLVVRLCDVSAWTESELKRREQEHLDRLAQRGSSRRVTSGCGNAAWRALGDEDRSGSLLDA